MHNVFSQSIVLSHQASHKLLSNPDCYDHMYQISCTKPCLYNSQRQISRCTPDNLTTMHRTFFSLSYPMVPSVLHSWGSRPRRLSPWALGTCAPAFLAPPPLITGSLMGKMSCRVTKWTRHIARKLCYSLQWSDINNTTKEQTRKVFHEAFCPSSAADQKAKFPGTFGCRKSQGDCLSSVAMFNVQRSCHGLTVTHC